MVDGDLISWIALFEISPLRASLPAPPKSLIPGATKFLILMDVHLAFDLNGGADRKWQIACGPGRDRSSRVLGRPPAIDGGKAFREHPVDPRLDAAARRGAREDEPVCSRTSKFQWEVDRAVHFAFPHRATCAACFVNLWKIWTDWTVHVNENIGSPGGAAAGRSGQGCGGR
jgi:hypothetical protein